MKPRELTRRQFAIRILVPALGLLVPSGALTAQQGPAHEENLVKAAFLMRFGQYVTWPPQSFQAPGGALVIGVTGSEGIRAGLVKLAAEREPSARPLTVLALKGADALPPMHVLFVGSEETRLETYMAATGSRPVLIVSDLPNALEEGAMIKFVVVDNHMKFEIDLDHVEKAKLSVSSRLLSIALRVRRGAADQAQQTVVAAEIRR